MISLLFLLLSAPSFASGDNISVTVNGKTYQCSGEGGGGNFVYYCKCRFSDAFWGKWAVAYYKMDRDSGSESLLRDLTEGTNPSGGTSEGFKFCEEALQREQLCRHGR